MGNAAAKNKGAAAAAPDQTTERTEVADVADVAQEEVYPAPAAYAPMAITGLQEGEEKYWCTCGLSKAQPWCDGSHQGTGMAPMKWVVPETKDYYVCACKYSKNKPLCDGSHVGLEDTVAERRAHCAAKDGHNDQCKLCTGCSWVPDF